LSYDYDNGDYEQQMDDASADRNDCKSQNPQNYQNGGYSVKHRDFPVFT